MSYIVYASSIDGGRSSSDGSRKPSNPSFPDDKKYFVATLYDLSKSNGVPSSFYNESFNIL